MGDLRGRLLLFAQEAASKVAEGVGAEGTGGAGAEAVPRGPGFQDFALPIAVTLLGLYFFIIRPEQRRGKQKQELLGGLKKNDKVITVGGIYGTVANVKPNEDEITLKIDEDKDVKIRVTRASIAHVIAAKDKEPEKSE